MGQFKRTSSLLTNIGMLGTTTMSSSEPLLSSGSNLYTFCWLYVSVPLSWNVRFTFSQVSLWDRNKHENVAKMKNLTHNQVFE